MQETSSDLRRITVEKSDKQGIAQTVPRIQLSAHNGFSGTTINKDSGAKAECKKTSSDLRRITVKKAMSKELGRPFQGFNYPQQLHNTQRALHLPVDQEAGTSLQQKINLCANCGRSKRTQGRPITKQVHSRRQSH
jgi:hypothetical protein